MVGLVWFIFVTPQSDMCYIFIGLGRVSKKVTNAQQENRAIARKPMLDAACYPPPHWCVFHLEFWMKFLE